MESENLEEKISGIESTMECAAVTDVAKRSIVSDEVGMRGVHSNQCDKEGGGTLR